MNSSAEVNICSSDCFGNQCIIGGCQRYEALPMRFHSFGMIFSWLFLAPFAVFMAWNARHFKESKLQVFKSDNEGTELKKKTNSDSAINSKKPNVKFHQILFFSQNGNWFNTHFYANMIAGILTLIATIAVFYYRGGFSSGSWVEKHMYYGFSTLILLFCLVFMGLARPNKGAKDKTTNKLLNVQRIRFNWIHGSFGFLAIILGWCSIYEAISFWEFYGFSKEVHDRLVSYSKILFWIYVVIVISCFIVAEILKRVIRKANVKISTKKLIIQIMDFMLRFFTIATAGITVAIFSIINSSKGKEYVESLRVQ